LKQVRGALNEKDAKRLKEKQKKLKMTEHGIITKLAKGVANGNHVIMEFLKDTKAVTIAYWFLCYSLIVATILLLL